MEMVTQAMSNMSLEPLKEPRVFIRCLELILAIFAFATTTSFSSSATFSVGCTGAKVEKSLSISYPFRINQNTYDVPFCSETTNSTVSIYGDFSSSAEFYVFVGVMAFLYTIAALILYIFFDDKIRENENIPTADFVITVVFVILWLISSSAWAQGVTDLKYYSNPEEQFHRLAECKTEGFCQLESGANYASLNVSIIFGFLNMFVWGGNLWFLYKETKWFHARESEVPPPPGSITQQPPMQPSPSDFPNEYPGQRI